MVSRFLNIVAEQKLRELWRKFMDINDMFSKSAAFQGINHLDRYNFKENEKNHS